MGFLTDLLWLLLKSWYKDFTAVSPTSQAPLRLDLYDSDSDSVAKVLRTRYVCIADNRETSKTAVLLYTAGLYEHHSFWWWWLPIYRDNQRRKWSGESFHYSNTIQFLHVYGRVAWTTPRLGTKDADITKQFAGELVRWVWACVRRPWLQFFLDASKQTSKSLGQFETLQ